MKHKVAAHLRGIKLNDLIVFTKKVQNDLQDPLFSSILPAPSTVLPKLNQLIVINGECSDRNYSRKVSRDILVKEIKQMLSDQCAAVNVLALGNVNILIKSGFQLAKQGSNPGRAAASRILKVTPGLVPNHFNIRFKSVPTRKYYIVTVIDSAGNVHAYPCANTKLLVKDLAVGQTVKIQVTAYNSNGKGQTCPFFYYYISPGPDVKTWDKKEQL